jgi:hypothetical protein
VNKRPTGAEQQQRIASPGQYTINNTWYKKILVMVNG